MSSIIGRVIFIFVKVIDINFGDGTIFNDASCRVVLIIPVVIICNIVGVGLRAIDVGDDFGDLLIIVIVLFVVISFLVSFSQC